MLVFNLLVVLVLVAYTYGYSADSKDFLKKLSSNDLKVGHFIDMLSNHPDTKKAPKKHLTATSWVQGGFMSLNYFNQPSDSTTPVCSSGEEIIYTGIDLGQCINDLNDSGNSYFFSCEDDEITYDTYTGTGCVTANLIDSSVNKNVNNCNSYASNPKINQMFKCTTSKNIPVPFGTITNAVHDAGDCDSNTMGYTGFCNGCCTSLEAICTTIGQYSAFAARCLAVGNDAADYDVKFSCDASNANPTGSAYYSAQGSCGTPIQALLLDTKCQQSPSVNGYTQSSSFYCQPTLSNDDDDVSAAGKDSPKNTGAIVGGVIGGIAVLAIGYFAYTKMAGGPDKKHSMSGNEL